MESFGSPEEEVGLNNTVPATHIIPFSSSSPPLFLKVSNPVAEGGMENVTG